MIRAALASLIGRRLTPPPPQYDDPPTPRAVPTFIGRSFNDSKMPQMQTMPRHLIEHGASAAQFINAIGHDLDHKPRLRSIIIRALHKYMDDHGPIGEGWVILKTGDDYMAAFRIEENPRGSVRMLYLVNAGPDASVADWISYSSVV